MVSPTGIGGLVVIGCGFGVAQIPYKSAALLIRGRRASVRLVLLCVDCFFIFTLAGLPALC